MAWLWTIVSYRPYADWSYFKQIMQIIWKKTIFPFKQYDIILWVATVFWTIVSYPPNINLGYFKQIMQSIWKNYLSPKTIYLHVRDIRKFTLPSHCLWASFHRSTPLLVVSVK